MLKAKRVFVCVRMRARVCVCVCVSQMATGAPPHAELHAMRVLFLIPMSPPPRLEGNFSNTFKDFVAQ